ncbi:MAG: copper homeostasis protein CutC, partial [Mesorhizobium sp.]
CKVGRVLTSGQRDTALEGADMLAQIVRQAGERIVILGCGGLAPGNIGEVRRRTGLREMHFAALADMRVAVAHGARH